MKLVASGLAAAACVVAGLAATPAQAQLAFGKMDRGLYLGGNVGWSHVNIDRTDIALPAGFAFSTFNADENEFGFKAFGGYRFSQNLALEAGYQRLGKFGFNGTIVPGPITASSRFKVEGWNVDAVGIIPLQNGFSILGRVGALFSTTKSTDTATFGTISAAANGKDHDANLKLGLGMQYDFSPAMGARLEWDHYRKVGDRATTGEGNINMLSVGLIYKLQ